MPDKTVQRIRLTLRQLEVFVATARAGSTRAGAGSLARSQSAASAALIELETVLGAEVFDRIGRRLALNENGRALLPRAVALVQQASELQSLLDSAHAAPLRLAASYTLGEYMLPQVISAWKRENPQSQVRLQIANTSDVLAALLEFQTDIGFIEGARTHPDLQVQHWMDDELVVIAGPSHPLVGKRATVKRLREAGWILREPGSGTREASDRWLLSQLREVDVVLELGSNEAVKRAVASGLGLGFLSRHAVAQAVEEGWLMQLNTTLRHMQRTFAVVVHKKKPLGFAAQDFLRRCLDWRGS